MPPKILTRFLCSAFLIGLVCSESPARLIQFRLQDSKTGALVPARCMLQNALGQHLRPVGETPSSSPTPQEFLTDGEFQMVLYPRLEYTLTVSRGMLWEPLTESFTLTPEDRSVTMSLKPYYRRDQQHWSTGDLSAMVGDPQLGDLMLAEDLNFVARPRQVSSTEELPRQPGSAFVHLSGERSFALLDWEVGDHFNVFGTPFDIRPNETPFTSSSLDQVAEAREHAALVELLDPSSADGLVAAAKGWVDVVRVVGPARTHQETWTRAELTDRYEAWYRLLNAGLRLPVSAGSCATEQARYPWDRIGSSRVFAQTLHTLTYGVFTKALLGGVSWATNGPILSLTVNGALPGKVLQARPGAEVKISFGARAPEGLEQVELVYNGQVVASRTNSATSEYVILETSLPVDNGGWIAGRAWGQPTDSGPAVQHAHTSPVYVEVRGTVPATRNLTGQGLARDLAQEARRIAGDSEVPPVEKEQLLGWYREASDFFRGTHHQDRP